MLFISREVHGNYGVVDTDDGTETFISAQQVAQCVLDLGLEIQGVKIGDWGYLGGGTPSRYLEAVIPMPPKAKSSLAKLKLFHGIDVRVYNDEIVYIDTNDSDKPRPRIVVSDYASKYSADTRHFFQIVKNPCVLVFNDRVQFSGEEFPDFNTAIVDIAQCSDQNPIVTAVYDVLLDQFSYDNFNSLVIDRKDRLGVYKLVESLSHDLDEDGEEFVSVYDFGVSDELLGQVMNKYCKWYLGFKLDDECMQYFPQSREFYEAALGGRDYDTLVKYVRQAIGVADATQEAMKQEDFYISFRVQNYYEYMNVTPENKKLYINFCHRIAVRFASMRGA